MWNSDIRVRKRPIDAVNHRHSRGNSRDFSSQPHIDGELPEEGRGPQREILLMTIPMMALVVSLMLMMANKSGAGTKPSETIFR